MRNRSKLSGLTRSTMFLLLAAVTLLPLSGCGPHSGLSSLRAGEAAEKSPNGKYWDIEADKWYKFALRDAQEVLALSEKGKAEAKMVAEAQYVLGKLYFGGKGVSQDYTEAAKWYQKSADQGNAEAIKLLADAKIKAQEADTRKVREQQEAEAQKVRAQQEGQIREQQEAEEKKAQAKRAEMAKNIIKQKIAVGRLQWAKRGTPGTIGELSVKQQPWVKLQHGNFSHSMDAKYTEIEITDPGVRKYYCSVLWGKEQPVVNWRTVPWVKIECISEPKIRFDDPPPPFQYTFVVMPDLRGRAYENPFGYVLNLNYPEYDNKDFFAHQDAWSKVVKPYVPPFTIASIIHTTNADLSVEEIEKRLDEKFAGMRKGLKTEDGGGFRVTYGEKGNGGVEVVAASYGKIIERIDFEQPIAVAEAQWNLIESEASATMRAKEKGKF